MGILLPPVTEVTTVNNNHLTMHHRNRSLDSALQRIPEVDVTPSPECEKVNSVLTTDAHSRKVPPSATKPHRDELTSLGSDDSGILCGSDSGSSDSNATRESSVEFLSNNQSQESLDTQLDAPSTSKQDLLSSRINNCKESKVSECSDSKYLKDKCDRTKEEHSECEQPKASTGLLRLLESKVFDVPMAMQYLFKSKEPGVQSYIANKMFSFKDSLVDFYLPQLVCMYIQIQDVAEVIHPYLVHR